jgi:Schlafen, AlbA_2
MRLLRESFDTIATDDIQQLCADQVPEGAEIELKSDLPSKAGRGADPWHAGGGIGDYARNEIAEEIIAFANTFGGIVCVGINETADHPKRAKSPNPLPRVHDLARRLRQAVYDIVDPPLPVLEAVGIECGGASGAGVVLLRVPPSRRRPHRHHISKEIFVRRADESVRITMREIHELTIQAVAEATRIDAIIKERRETFRTQTLHWLKSVHQSNDTLWGGGMHFVGIPTSTLDLGRVVGRPRLQNFLPAVSALFGERKIACMMPHASMINWRPGLRSITSEVKTQDRSSLYTLHTTGLCELSFRFKATEERPGLFIGWLVGMFGFMLAWIDRIRSEAGNPTEFALAPVMSLLGPAFALAGYGASSFADDFAGTTVPAGFHEFPITSVGPLGEFSMHLARFSEDLSNLAGQDNLRTAPTFSLTLSP